jgi:hypothetical protein
MGIVKEEDLAGHAPDMFWLDQNYPNPFNPATEIRFSVGTRAVVSLHVYDVLGREIATLVNDELPAGVYRVQWDAKEVAGGVYYYRMRARNFHAVKKMVLCR